MNASSKNMDFLTKHWAPFPRKYPSLFPLATSDYVPAKKDWVRWKFDTCNFSLILQGEGLFERAGRTWPVQAPCVITQWPGEVLSYGPTGGSWAEWYLIYDRSRFSSFRQRGLIDVAKPVWPIADPASVLVHLAEFAVLSRSPDPAWVADRVDRIAERTILDTWLSPSAPAEEGSEIRGIAGGLRGNLSKRWDFQELAIRHGFSTTTFRRRWVETMGTPPSQYLQQLRIAEACRLLVETSLRIKDIALATGFDDELYFSRRFRIEVGRPPREYRRTYRLKR
ncbi:MAG: helix-turn-helix domain-containing protein [Terrimicrobiaceae bacterium]